MADFQKPKTAEQFLIEPVTAAKDSAVDAYNKFGSALNQLGQKVATVVRPAVPMDPAAVEREQAVAGTAAEFIMDPTNFITPGAKALTAAGILAKAAPKMADVIHIGKAASKAVPAAEVAVKAAPIAEAVIEAAPKAATKWDQLAPTLKNLNKSGMIKVTTGLPETPGMAKQIQALKNAAIKAKK